MVWGNRSHSYQLLVGNISVVSKQDGFVPYCNLESLCCLLVTKQEEVEEKKISIL